MSVIEQRISKNKKVFDVHEPESAHFSRFEDKLRDLHPEEEPSKVRTMFPMMRKVAAIALILIIVSLVVFEYPGLLKGELSAEDVELQELTVFYASNNLQKMNEINELAEEDFDVEQLKDKAMRSIEKLQNNNEKLQEEYVSSNKDKRVFSAIVNNYRLLSTALDQVITNMRTVKNKKSSY